MNQENRQYTELARLHRRHTAQLVDKLKEVQTAKIIVDAVLKQFSFYTDDVRNQVIKMGEYEQDRQ